PAAITFNSVLPFGQYLAKNAVNNRIPVAIFFPEVVFVDLYLIHLGSDVPRTVFSVQIAAYRGIEPLRDAGQRPQIQIAAYRGIEPLRDAGQRTQIQIAAYRGIEPLRDAGRRPQIQRAAYR